MTDRDDLVVIGGGLAGLSLALRLAQAGHGGRVRIIEPRTQYEDDRSWAFWTPRESAWSASATRTWDQWLFANKDGAPVTGHAPGWCYAYVRSIDFYRTALRVLADCPNISLELGTRVSTVAKAGDGVEVMTSAGVVSAKHVVDTRPPPPGQLAGATLFQCFAGRELALDEAGFDDRRVELMTDMRADDAGFAFSYVLPLSPHRALVEATRFSRQPLGTAALGADLDALLASRGWSQAQVLRTESAVLPMGLPVADVMATVPGVVRAGLGGGALRAASGYGFLRIQAWAERCANVLCQGLPPLGHPAEPRLQRWMDAVFLRALAQHPERTPEFFLRLASSVPGPALVRFLSDQARWTDHARIVAALPPGPFLQALHRRPRRAGLAA